MNKDDSAASCSPPVKHKKARKKKPGSSDTDVETDAQQSSRLTESIVLDGASSSKSKQKNGASKGNEYLYTPATGDEAKPCYNGGALTLQAVRDDARTKDLMKVKDNVEDEPKAFTTSTVNLNSTGVSFLRPRYVNFALSMKRKQSFNTSGDFLPNTQISVDELVDCGYFETATGWVCYYCGVTQEKWNDDDSPWIEHARWSPNCTHIHNIRGLTFVKEVLQVSNDREQLKLLDQKYKQLDQSKEQEAAHLGAILSHLPPKDLNKDLILAYPAVRSVLEMERNTEKVLCAVNILCKRKRTVQLDFNAEELMQVVLDIDDGLITKEETLRARRGLINLDENMTLSQFRIEAYHAIQQNKLLKKSLICKRCENSIVGIIFLPCSHVCTCVECAQLVDDCLVCKRHINATLRMFMS